MSNKSSKKKPTKTKKNIALALLIVGLVSSVLCFVASLGLLLLYCGVYAIALLIVVLVCLVVLVILGFALFIIYFFIAFIAALFGANNFDFMNSILPKDWSEIFPQDLFDQFGKSSLWYAIGIPIVTILIVISTIAMIFSIIALVRLCKARKKSGGVVGGVLAILGSITGMFSIAEFAGGILMFFISSEEYALGHELEIKESQAEQKPTSITKKELIDLTDK